MAKRPKVDAAIKPPMSRGIIGALLFTRALSFLMIQLLFATLFQLAGHANWWSKSQSVWPVTAVLGSILTFFILHKMLKAEGSSYKSLLSWNGQHLKKDAPFILLLILVIAPVGFFSGDLFAQLLYNDPTTAIDTLMKPLPRWAVYGSILMPLAIALTELPFYFGYGMKRLKEEQKGWWPLYLPVFFLALQHSFLPFVFSWQFFIWRFLMFLPLAILLGLFLFYRPKSLPVLVIIHFLMDAGTVVYILQISGI